MDAITEEFARMALTSLFTYLQRRGATKEQLAQMYEETWRQVEARPADALPDAQ